VAWRDARCLLQTVHPQQKGLAEMRNARLIVVDASASFSHRMLDGYMNGGSAV
jgi:hypothetical protein